MKWLAVALMMMAGLQQASAPVERQEPSVQEIPGLKIESRLVPVAVNVTDAQGAAVPNLQATDFEVYEDGAAQKMAIFERESSTPLEIVLVVDASESTFAETKLERDAARDFIKALVRPIDRVSLFSFADDVTEVVPFTSDARQVQSALGHLQHGEASAVYDAVYLAAQRLHDAPDPRARKVVVMITDGENTTRHGSYNQALEEAERSGAMIYSLIVIPVEADAGRNTGGEHALIQMSRDTGGKYYEIAAKQDIAPAFARLSDDLRTQYTVGYYAPRKALDDAGQRRILIRLKDPALAAKYTLQYRTAYYAR